ncbi:hypothetical protein K505DRAFT_379556 [Melanomma pulvis-pyrius CBS 109.77]|uniref:Oxidoreductase acuF-like C2H2 type zinc-finger domain-containing protein n=1 Tax=Melanomma pulvis-pyrius CBS 109.77 TaxID=1314802 RepID=A0A6A6WTS0_9PLEO|nr:hypothetical protein K505DRAFT_379556 [Melanomma pulvis-pyrius CBS 109.77]
MDSSISQAHFGCIDGFLALANALKTSERADTARLPGILGFEDAFDNYNLWAGNLGAMNCGQQYKKSLDYRLREASFFRVQVLKLLKDLRVVLEKALSLTADNRIAEADIASSHSEVLEMDQSREEDSPWEMSSDSEGDRSPTAQEYLTSASPEVDVVVNPGAPETSQSLLPIFESVSHIVKCLWRLPLRRPVPLDRVKERAVSEASLYQEFDSMHVRNKFPTINQSLATRLGKMISRRRQLIRYRKIRTDALQGKLGGPKASETLKGITVQRAFGVHTSDGDGGNEIALSFEVPSYGTYDTKATTLKPYGPILDLRQSTNLLTPSSSESRSSVYSEQNSQDTPMKIPRRPRGENGEALEQFICPYCSTAQFITSDRRWKKHVLSDLQPFVCTFSECELHEYVFEGREDWFRHEQSHRYEWFCNHETHKSFSELPDFLQHMERIHQNTLGVEQSHTLMRSFQRPSRSQSGNCSLCGKHSTSLKLHLSRHLEQLSLFAIPQTDYMLDVNVEEVQSDIARRSFGASTGSAVTSEQSEHLVEVSSFEDSTGLEPTLRAGEPGASLVNEESPPDLPGDFENNADTSWDNIVPKFREAREAMNGRQEQRPSSIQSDIGPSDKNDAQTVDFHFYEKPMCGASIGAYRDGKHLPPCSLGGIILVDSEPYGMTVVHLLDDPNKSEEGLVEETYEGDGVVEQWASWNRAGLSDSGFDYKLDRDIRGNQLGIEHGIPVTQPSVNDLLDGFDPIPDRKDDYYINTYTLGHIHTSSTSWNLNGEIANQMDWALIKISPERLQAYNIIQGGKKFCKKKAFAPELPLHHDYADLHEKNQHEYPTEVADSSDLGGRKVHWFGRTSGLQSGVIQDSKSKIRGMGPPGVIPFWDLKKIVQGNCAREGDAGAWVVDDESRVCGYIVASDYDSKTTYFRPMDVAFRDIRKVLRAKTVCLPVFRAPAAENSVNTSLDRRTPETGVPGDRLLATDDFGYFTVITTGIVTLVWF